MNFNGIKIVSVITACIAVLLWIIFSHVRNLNRKKGIAAGIAALVYSLFAGYYLYMVFVAGMAGSPGGKEPGDIPAQCPPVQDISTQEMSQLPRPDIDFLVFLEVNGNIYEVADGDEIEISRKSKFRIKEVKTEPQVEGIKADFKGFAGNARSNDLQDTGYWIEYPAILKHWKMKGEKDKYEIQVLKEKEHIGSIYIIFSR